MNVSLKINLIIKTKIRPLWLGEGPLLDRVVATSYSLQSLERDKSSGDGATRWSSQGMLQKLSSKKITPY